MQYLVIVLQEGEDKGTVYGYYENPVTAKNTAINLVQSGYCVKAFAAKVI
jgi:hypothetical protein